MSLNDDNFTPRYLLRIAFTAVCILGLIGLTTAAFGSCRVVDTAVQRKVFENSHQYQESANEQVRLLEASLIEIDAQLSNPNLSEDTRTSLSIQRSTVNAQLQAAKAKTR